MRLGARLLRRLVLVASTVAVSAAMMVAIPGSAFAVVDGERSVGPSVTPFVGYVTGKVGNDVTGSASKSCGATLVSPDLALTAEHCLYHPRNGRIAAGAFEPKDLRITFGKVKRSGSAGATSDVVEILRPDGYIPNGKRHDIALLRLKTPMPQYETPIVGQCPRREELIFAAGWGQAEANESKALKNDLEEALHILAPPDTPGDFNHDELRPSTPQSGTLKFGDSGTGAFMLNSEGTKFVLVGVLHAFSAGAPADRAAFWERTDAASANARFLSSNIPDYVDTECSA